MKRKLTILLTAAVMALSSCSLDEQPTSFTDFDHFYQTVPQCQAAVNSCYAPILSIYTGTFLLITEAVTDLAFMESSDHNTKLHISPANPEFGTSMWTNGYRGVMYCNAAIEGIKRSPISDYDRNPLLADAIAMRAMYYYILTASFGDVPFYTEAVLDEDILGKVAVLGRMPASETRAKMIEELLEYADYLPQKRACDVADNRMVAPFAYMMIGKLAMWNGDYETAATALGKICDIYGDLDQYPFKDVMASNRNAKESIFEIQRRYSTTGIKKTTTVASMCTPLHSDSQVEEEKDLYDGMHIPELGKLAVTWTCISANTYFFRTLFANEDDIRRDMTLGYQYKGVTFDRYKNGGRPWLGPKFWNFGMISSNDGNNQKVFRYADVLLMLAECANETGDGATAVEMINKVRARANATLMGSYPGHDEFFEKLIDERALELFGEYGRKWDLVRWGLWYERTLKRTESGNIKMNIRPCHEYYPIPDSEVVRSKGALTNDAYHAYSN